MSAFAFDTVASILSEPGASKRLGELIAERFPAVRRPFIVTDAGVLRAGLLDLPGLSLEQQGMTSCIFSGVLADPPEAVVLDAVEAARRHEADLVLGFGGGSSMDVAKLVAVLTGSRQAIGDIYGIGKLSDSPGDKRLPLVQVPTTAGTGSEVTNIAIVTTGAATKSGVVAHGLYADLAVLDAGLTLGLPPAMTAATGIDAMVHAIEAYTSRHRKNPLSDALAREALSLLSRNLLRACENGADVAVRQAMLLGACLAGQAFSNAPVAAVHALAYPIGGIFHVPHGLSNSLVLPHVLRFNLAHAVRQYAELAAVVAPAASGSEEARAVALIVATQQIARMSGIETGLRQVGIKEADLDRLADAAMLQTRLLGNNPRDVTREDARAIYAAAL